MAHTIKQMENPRTGQVRPAPMGFSWTFFFFGSFVPLTRSDWKWGVITFIAALLTYGISHLVFMFIYNGLYLKDLQANGYKEVAE